MKREDLVTKARLIAKIDAPEEGVLSEEDILNLILEIADENDRLETELSEVKKQYADAFLTEKDSGVKEENEGDEEEKEIEVEEFMDL